MAESDNQNYVALNGRILKRLGLSFATRLIQSGGAAFAVSELLDHASVQTTEIYYHGGKQAKRPAVRMVRLPYVSGGGRRNRREKGWRLLRVKE